MPQIEFSKDDFQFSRVVQVRWSDLDALNHINNAVYVTYLEEARIHYLEAIGWNWDTEGLILAKNEVNYLSPITDIHDVTIYIRCSRMGSKSFDLEYAVLDYKDQLAVFATTVLVTYDFKAHKSVAIPEHIRLSIQQFESSN